MENRTIAPVKPELIITVVERDEARFYEDLIQSLGANVQMTVDGHGTANKRFYDVSASRKQKKQSSSVWFGRTGWRLSLRP